MANQTLPLNVSAGMKSDNERQNCVGMERVCLLSRKDK